MSMKRANSVEYWIFHTLVPSDWLTMGLETIDSLVQGLV